MRTLHLLHAFDRNTAQPCRDTSLALSRPKGLSCNTRRPPLWRHQNLCRDTPNSHLCHDIKICVETRFVTPNKSLGHDTKSQFAISKLVPSSIYVATSKFGSRHRNTPTACGHVATSRFMTRPRYPSLRPNPVMRTVPMSWASVGVAARAVAWPCVHAHHAIPVATPPAVS